MSTLAAVGRRALRQMWARGRRSVLARSKRSPTRDSAMIRRGDVLLARTLGFSTVVDGRVDGPLRGFLAFALEAALPALCAIPPDRLSTAQASRLGDAVVVSPPGGRTRIDKCHAAQPDRNSPARCGGCFDRRPHLHALYLGPVACLYSRFQVRHSHVPWRCAINGRFGPLRICARRSRHGGARTGGIADAWCRPSDRVRRIFSDRPWGSDVAHSLAAEFRPGRRSAPRPLWPGLGFLCFSTGAALVRASISAHRSGAGG